MFRWRRRAPPALFSSDDDFHGFRGMVVVSTVVGTVAATLLATLSFTLTATLSATVRDMVIAMAPPWLLCYF
jgi:hypothetical protein